MVFEVGDREIPLSEVTFVHDTEVERDARLDTMDDELAERPLHTSDCRRPGGGVHDELSQKGVVMKPDFGAGSDAAVPPDAGSRGDFEAVDATGGGKKPLVGILTRDAALDGMPRKRHVLLREIQGLSKRHPNLPLHQIEAGHELRDRVLDL